MRHAPPIEFKSADPGEEPGVDAKVDELAEKLAKAAEGKSEALEVELKAIKADLAALKRTPGAADDAKALKEIEAKAFEVFARKGAEQLSPDEKKSLRVADSTAGGYLAPEEFVRELDRNLVEFSPIRAAARVSSTTAGSVILPKRTSTLSAYWVSEDEERTATQTAYGQTAIDVGEIACYVDVSNQLLEDAAFDLASELAFDFAEEFGRVESEAHIKGDGVKKPLGLLNTAGILTTKSGGASGFASSSPADALIQLYYDVKGAYAANAVWGMNRSTMATVRKFKDGQGQYLWANPISEGQPATLLGRPVVEMPDLPDVAAGVTPIVFGDFRHYRIFDRLALSILRDPYSQATVGRTRFHARRRVGGGVTRTEAFRLLKIEA